jgi:phosphoribosylformylglycinamidine synthase PurS subunit
MTQFELIVRPRPGARDPQAEAVSAALRDSDFPQVRTTSVGRYMLLSVEESDSERALEQAHRVCRAMLVNPHLETYELRPALPEADSASPSPRGM